MDCYRLEQIGNIFVACIELYVPPNPKVVDSDGKEAIGPLCIAVFEKLSEFLEGTDQGLIIKTLCIFCRAFEFYIRVIMNFDAMMIAHRILYANASNNDPVIRMLAQDCNMMLFWRRAR